MLCKSFYPGSYEIDEVTHSFLSQSSSEDSKVLHSALILALSIEKFCHQLLTAENEYNPRKY